MCGATGDDLKETTAKLRIQGTAAAVIAGLDTAGRILPGLRRIILRNSNIASLSRATRFIKLGFRLSASLTFHSRSFLEQELANDNKLGQALARRLPISCASNGQKGERVARVRRSH
jgi:hypothetical protein